MVLSENVRQLHLLLFCKLNQSAHSILAKEREGNGLLKLQHRPMSAQGHLRTFGDTTLKVCCWG